MAGAQACICAQAGGVGNTEGQEEGGLRKERCTRTVHGREQLVLRRGLHCPNAALRGGSRCELTVNAHTAGAFEKS